MERCILMNDKVEFTCNLEKSDYGKNLISVEGEFSYKELKGTYKTRIYVDFKGISKFYAHLSDELVISIESSNNQHKIDDKHNRPNYWYTTKFNKPWYKRWFTKQEPEKPFTKEQFASCINDVIEQELSAYRLEKVIDFEKGEIATKEMLDSFKPN